jgi:hypothetical protein
MPMIMRFYWVAVMSLCISGDFSFDLSLLWSEMSSSGGSSEKESSESEGSEPARPSGVFCGLPSLASYPLSRPSLLFFWAPILRMSFRLNEGGKSSFYAT